MTKKEFMQKLKDNLIGLNQNDKREVLLDYEEHFMDGKQQGRTEEEICEALGDPKEIAMEIKSQSQQNAPNNDGVNIVANIFGMIVLSGACIGLISILFSVVAAAISGVFGAVAVATFFTDVTLKIAAISAVVFAVSICTLIALGIVKLIPVVIKWFKQMAYSMDNKPEKAKAVQYKKVKIHALVWILLSLLSVASICGMIVGGVGFAREVVENYDIDDIRELEEFVYDITTDHGRWVYYDEYGAMEFEEAMEEFAEDMEEFADDMEDKYGRWDRWYFGWRFIGD